MENEKPLWVRFLAVVGNWPSSSDFNSVTMICTSRGFGPIITLPEQNLADMPLPALFRRGRVKRGEQFSLYAKRMPVAMGKG